MQMLSRNPKAAEVMIDAAGLEALCGVAERGKTERARQMAVKVSVPQLPLCC